MKLTILFLTIAPIMLFIRSQALAQGFVRAESTKLIIGDKEYRAIGANQPDLFTSYAAPELFAQYPETYVNIEQANELKQNIMVLPC